MKHVRLFKQNSWMTEVRLQAEGEKRETASLDKTTEVRVERRAVAGPEDLVPTWPGSVTNFHKLF